MNVSPQELLHPGYPGLVALVLEITETALIPDERGRDATLTVRILRELGVRVFLDDFGSGYSSLERLAALPVDGLKLGQAFTQALGNPPDPKSPAARLVAAVLALAQALGLAAGCGRRGCGAGTSSRTRRLGPGGGRGPLGPEGARGHPLSRT